MRVSYKLEINLIQLLWEICFSINSSNILAHRICNCVNYAYETGSKMTTFQPEARFEPTISKPATDVVLPVTFASNSWLNKAK